MSVFSIFRKTRSGFRGVLDYRRFNLESLEDRCLLSVNAGFASGASALTAGPAATGDEDVFIQIGDTQAGLTQDTYETVSLAEGHTISNVTVQIDAFFTNGWKNVLTVDNSGKIEVFDFQTSSSVYQMLQSAWGAVMGSTPVPTQQELYYYYYDGETAASNPFNTGSDENITAFLTALQSGNARYKALANQIIARMKGMHEVADATTLYVTNNESGTIGEGLDKLWGFGGGVTFENSGTISCDIDSTDGQGADYFLNDGGTMQGFASGSTDDLFITGGGAVNGDVSVGDGDDTVIVYDTTDFGGEITFGNGDDDLVLYGSALGEAGTIFSATLADAPERIFIFDIAKESAAETTVTINTVIPDTDVIVDFSLVDATAYGEYGVAIGAEGDLTAVGAYTVKLDTDAVLGSADGKVVLFSGAMADNFNLDAEFTFDGVTLVINDGKKLDIGGYQYSLLYDGQDVYLQRVAADLVTVSVTAVDKYTGEDLEIDGGTIRPDNVADVTVSFENTGDAAVTDKFFYSAVRVRDAEGNYIVNRDGSWYERYCAGPVASGETGSFRFLLPRLAAGEYTIEIQLNNRGTVEESNYDDDYTEVTFTVAVPTAAFDFVSVETTGRTSGETVELADGAKIQSEINDVTVTYRNATGEDIDAPYLYGGVKLQDSDGNYIIGSADGWYERLSYDGLGADEEGSFKFVMKALPAGDYTLTLALDQRCAIAEIPNIQVINFKVPGSGAEECDMVNVGISAVDKYTGDEIDLAAVTTKQTPLFTVAYKNQGAEANAPYFYSSVQVVKSDGTVILDTYERLSKTGLGAGEEGSFTFLLGKQAAGTYTVKVQLDNREALDQSSYDNDYAEYVFEVVEAEAAALPGVFADEAFVDDLFVDF